MDIDIIYRKLGEFVVSFQWLEHRYRELGWFILDPNRNHWPPRALRTESFNELLSKVQELYVDVVYDAPFKYPTDPKKSFKVLVSKSRHLNKYRNNLVHSAYTEIKSCGEVLAILRTNPKIIEKPKSSDWSLDQEILTPESFSKGLEDMANIAFELNLHYTQILQWY